MQLYHSVVVDLYTDSRGLMDEELVKKIQELPEFIPVGHKDDINRYLHKMAVPCPACAQSIYGNTRHTPTSGLQREVVFLCCSVYCYKSDLLKVGPYRALLARGSM
eukprot:2354756-Amphidinium_carterae.3